jgi:transcriptional regulator with XRE-family HTH domain
MARPYTRSTRTDNEVQIDQHVGERLKQRRLMQRMSQTDLGNALGITFQQIQKYEKGSNRIGASRLWRLSQVLEVPITYFFEGLELHGHGPQHEDDDLTTFLKNRESVKLVRDFHAISDPAVRQRIYSLIKSLS